MCNYDFVTPDIGDIVEHTQVENAYGKVVGRTSKGVITVQWDSGWAGLSGGITSSHSKEYLTIVQKEIITNKQKEKPMMNLSFIEKLVLPKEVKTLKEMGYLNGDLSLTDKGRNALMSILFDANKLELVKLAEEEKAESKKITLG